MALGFLVSKDPRNLCLVHDHVETEVEEGSAYIFKEFACFFLELSLILEPDSPAAVINV